MKKIVLAITTVMLIFNSWTAFGWGQKGHDIIAYMAWCHMTPKAQKAVTKALEGHTMMYYSSWMDNIRDLEPYCMTATWHYANVDEGQSYDSMQKEPAGDVYTATSMIVDALRTRNLSDSLENVYVKFLIHLIGDMHCPMHAGRLSDRGGNDFKIRWFGQPTSLHSIWDSSFIESARKWSYTEWKDNIDYLSKNEIKEMSDGSLFDWFNETVTVCKRLYLGAEEGENYSYAYMFENYPVLEQQLQRGGYRLARLLNEIYR